MILVFVYDNAIVMQAMFIIWTNVKASVVLILL